MSMKMFRSSTLALASAFLVWMSVPPAASPQQFSRSGNSEWSDEISKLAELLRKHKWKGARSGARALGKKVLSKSWYGPDLGRVLAQIALTQAIAEANLHNDREAIWYWHIATNLDFRLRKSNLSAYGEAADLLYEHLLRAKGEMPAGFENLEVTPTTPSTRPVAPEMEPPTILNNTAAVREKPGDFHVEVVVDKFGELHHPVVISTYLHPIVIYAVLEWIRDLPPFKPRTIEGERTDSIYHLTVDFTYSRW